MAQYHHTISTADFRSRHIQTWAWSILQNGLISSPLDTSNIKTILYTERIFGSIHFFNTTAYIQKFESMKMSIKLLSLLMQLVTEYDTLYTGMDPRASSSEYQSPPLHLWEEHASLSHSKTALKVVHDNFIKERAQSDTEDTTQKLHCSLKTNSNIEWTPGDEHL